MDYAFAIVTALLIGVSYFHVRQSAAWTVERGQLLDRLMARNFTDYVAGTREIASEPTVQLTTDEAEAAWYAAAERDRIKEVA